MKKVKILSKIVLKYYKTPEKNTKEKTGITCAWCLDSNVVNIGGGFKDEKGKIHQICEDCAVLRYKEDFGFKSMASARARRRRIFDVGYLFNEIILDEYLSFKNITDFSKIEADLANDIFIKASQLYNYLFSKEDKIQLEEMENQDDIESELYKRISATDLNKFFGDL